MQVERLFLSFSLSLAPGCLYAQNPSSQVEPSDVLDVDPAFARILKEEPPLRIQQSITYLDFTAKSWVLCPIDPAGGTTVRWNNAPVRVVKPPRSGNVFATCYGQSALWSTVGSDLSMTVELLRLDLDRVGGKWEHAGRFDGEGGIPTLVLPLKKQNCFLGISPQPLFLPGADQASYAGVFRNRDGKLTLETCIDLPFDDKANIVTGKWLNFPKKKVTATSAPVDPDKPKQFWMGFADPAVLAPSLSLPSISADYLVLAAASAGVLWVLDLEDGRVCRTINLTGLRRQELAKLGKLRHVILGTGFTPGGDLIVAAKDPNLIRLTTALATGSPDPQESEAREREFQAFAAEIKEIQWLRINPKTGAQERLESPVDFPERVPTTFRHTVFRFLVDPLGHVKSNAFTSWPRLLESFLADLPKDAPAKPAEPVKPAPAPAADLGRLGPPR